MNNNSIVNHEQWNEKQKTAALPRAAAARSFAAAGAFVRSSSSSARSSRYIRAQQQVH